MKRLHALILLQNKHVKEKYLHLGLLLFFSLCSFFALSENNDAPIDITFPTSQKQPTDSLKKNADSLFNLINTKIKQGDFVKAEIIAKRSLDFYQEIRDQSGIGNCFNKIATISYYIADFPKALLFYDKSIAIYKEVDFQKGVASSLNNKGAIYYHLGNYSQALDHYKQAIMLNETLGNIKQKTTALRNIGGIYLELDEYDKAMTHFETARKMYEELGEKGPLAKVMNAIGEIYLKQEKYKLAFQYIQNGLHIAETIEDKQQILFSIFTMGTLKSAQKEYEGALLFYKKAYQQAEILTNQRYKALSLIALGEISFERNNTPASLANCTKGLLISQQLQLIAAQKDACDCLYRANKYVNNQRKALYYYEKSTHLTDSLQTRKIANRMLHMEFKKEQLLDSIFHAAKELKVQQEHQRIIKKKEDQRNLLMISGCFIIVIATSLWSRLRFTKKSKAKLQLEKDRSEHLLLNILPEEIAEELKEKGYVDAQDFETASILFTDFKSFTETASKLSPQELVEEINVCFKAFDVIMETYHIEKIKTIGDAYMAAGGLSKPDTHTVKNTILAALEMQSFIRNRKKENGLHNKPAFEMRVGIHVGPIVAGIVGVKKFQYDIWGDTVNTASRMESNGEAGKVNISQDTYTLVQYEPDLTFEYRGKIEAKGKGALAMYFVSRKSS